MKRLLRMIAAMVSILCLVCVSGCSGKDPAAGLEKSTLTVGCPDVTANAEPSSLSPDGKLTLTLTYTGDGKEYYCGYEPALERLIDGVWYTIPVREDCCWIDLAAALTPESTTQTMEFTLSDCFEKLEPGQYRFLKTLISEERVVVAAEFQIL